MPARIGEHIRKVIKKRFSASYMSDAKWRKLFLALAPLELKQAYWKFVDLDDEFSDRFVEADDIMEEYVGDCGIAGGPFAYQRIEWIEIPAIGRHPIYKTIPHMEFEQNIQEVKNKLDEIGLFEVHQTERGIRVYAYR